jgi:Skp family chaperone for outer membrane proteins
MGFKAPGDVKIGNVDIGKVFSESEYSKKQQENLRLAQAARRGVMELIGTYRVMKPDDAQKFHDLSIKDKPVAEDKTEMDRITAAAKDDDTKYRALATKSSPTPQELASIEEYNKRKDATGVLQQKWAQEFDSDLASLQEKARADALTKVREAVGTVAKEQGYSIVFVSDIAPYSANDLTESATKAMAKYK